MSFERKGREGRKGNPFFASFALLAFQRCL